jgi:hypothetical protein
MSRPRWGPLKSISTTTIMSGNPQIFSRKTGIFRFHEVLVIEINLRGSNAPTRPSESFVGQLHATLASAQTRAARARPR